METKTKKKKKRRVGELSFVKSSYPIIVHFDGCCEPTNPGGHAGYGIHIARADEVLFTASGYVEAGPLTSNNVAEYRAFIEALEWLGRNGCLKSRIAFFGDSQLVINQMFGTWRIKGGLYVESALLAKKLLGSFSDVRGFWIPRGENHVADRLSKAELLKRGVRFRIQPETARENL